MTYGPDNITPKASQKIAILPITAYLIHPEMINVIFIGTMACSVDVIP